MLLKCAGGAIVVFEDGQLIVSSCDIRGQGRRDVLEAYSGGGVFVLAYRTIVSFFNTTFRRPRCGNRRGIQSRRQNGRGSTCRCDFSSLRFRGNYVADGAGDFQFATYDQIHILYDCVFERNEGHRSFSIYFQTVTAR